MTTPPTLGRRVLAELVGTALLTATVVGSGVAASRLSPDDVGIQLLQNSIATSAVLVALIVALQPVSASFNPVVTAVEIVLSRLSPRTAAALVGGQVVGAGVGCVLANLMFDLDAVTFSTRDRVSSATLLAEVVATAGLVLLVFATLRSGRIESVALVVGGYIAAAYWFTSSTSFANPAVTLGRMLTDTFAGISPASVAPFVLAQVVGGLVGLGVVRALYPTVPIAVPTEEHTS